MALSFEPLAPMRVCNGQTKEGENHGNVDYIDHTDSNDAFVENRCLWRHSTCRGRATWWDEAKIDARAPGKTDRTLESWK